MKRRQASAALDQRPALHSLYRSFDLLLAHLSVVFVDLDYVFPQTLFVLKIVAEDGVLAGVPPKPPIGINFPGVFPGVGSLEKPLPEGVFVSAGGFAGVMKDAPLDFGTCIEANPIRK